MPEDRNTANISLKTELIDEKDNSNSVEVWYIVIAVVILFIATLITVFIIIIYRKRALTAKNIQTQLANATDLMLGVDSEGERGQGNEGQGGARMDEREGRERVVIGDGSWNVRGREIETTTRNIDLLIITHQALPGTHANSQRTQMYSDIVQEDSG